MRALVALVGINNAEKQMSLSTNPTENKFYEKNFCSNSESSRIVCNRNQDSTVLYCGTLKLINFRSIYNCCPINLNLFFI